MNNKLRTSYTTAVALVMRQEREAKGISQSAMGKALDITGKALSLIERGDSNLYISHVAQAATVLGMKPSELFKKTEQLISQLETQGWVVSYEKLPTEMDNLLSGLKGITGSGSLTGTVAALSGIVAYANVGAMGSVVGFLARCVAEKLKKNEQ